MTDEEKTAKIMYFRKQAQKWRDVAFRIAEEERGLDVYGYAIRKAEEFGIKAKGIEDEKT